MGTSSNNAGKVWKRNHFPLVVEICSGYRMFFHIALLKQFIKVKHLKYIRTQRRFEPTLHCSMFLTFEFTTRSSFTDFFS